MSLLTLALVLIIVGVALWIVNTMIPMNAKVKTLLNVVVIVVVVVWVLQAVGLVGPLHDIRIR